MNCDASVHELFSHGMQVMSKSHRHAHKQLGVGVLAGMQCMIEMTRIMDKPRCATVVWLMVLLAMVDRTDGVLVPKRHVTYIRGLIHTFTETKG